MSSQYPIVRQRLVDIVEATTVDDTSAGNFGPFVHLEEGLTELAHVDRKFFIQLESGAGQLPGSFDIKGRIRAVVSLVILYSSDVRRLDEVDAVVGSDYENLAAQLLKQSNWQTPTSGLELVGSQDGGHESMQFEVGEFDEKTLALTLEFPIVYRRGPETNI